MSRSRRGSSPPDPDLVVPPPPMTRDLEDNEDPCDEDTEVDDDDENDRDFMPAYTGEKSTPKKLPSAMKGTDKKRNSLPAKLQSTPKVRFANVYYSSKVPNSASNVKYEDGVEKRSRRVVYKLSSADRDDIATGSVELRKALIKLFDKVYQTSGSLPNLAQDELSRLLIWLSSIKQPSEETKVKYDWAEAFRIHLHGEPGELLPFKIYCLKVFQTSGWDLEWPKHIFFRLSVKERTQVLCAVMSMYLETKEYYDDTAGSFKRIRNVPETDWDLVCKRQDTDLELGYCKIKSILTRLRNLGRSDIKKGKATKPKSEERIEDDDEGDDIMKLDNSDEEGYDATMMKGGREVPKSLGSRPMRAARSKMTISYKEEASLSSDDKFEETPKRRSVTSRKRSRYAEEDNDGDSEQEMPSGRRHEERHGSLEAYG